MTQQLGIGNCQVSWEVTPASPADAQPVRRAQAPANIPAGGASVPWRIDLAKIPHGQFILTATVTRDDSPIVSARTTFFKFAASQLFPAGRLNRIQNFLSERFFIHIVRILLVCDDTEQA